MRIGTYLGARYNQKSKDKIQEVLKDIPGAISPEKLHSTIIFSRNPVYIVPHKDISWKAVGTKLEVWLDAVTESNILVLILDSEDLVNRYDEIMGSTAATYDYEEYIPHITLAYDVISEFNLPSFEPMELTIIEEYVENLDLEWKDTN